MNADTVRMVAYALLKPRKAAFLDEGSLRDFLLSSGTCPLENATLPEELSSLAKEILAEYTFSRDNLLGLRSSEAAGVPLLGHFLLRVVRLLKNVTSSDFKSVMEFHVLKRPIAGRDPSTDGAVVAIHEVTGVETEKPVLIYEYKPVVHPSAPSVRDRLDSLIQVFYCFRQYRIKSCLLCLTDLHTWHYFKANSSMEIEWMKVLREPSPTPCLPALQDHLSFIAAAVKDVV